MHKLASPTRFFKYVKGLRIFLMMAAIGCTVTGLMWGFFFVPPDYQQGDAVRLMFVHVPASWMGLFSYGAMAIFVLCSYIWRHLMANLLIQAIAPIGMVFTLLSLITGALWGRITWGVWWVWDARLTSMLVLFFFYVAYYALLTAFNSKMRGIAMANLVVLIGAGNLPIIKWSVNWWHTLHQPASLTKLASPSLHISYLLPLLMVALGYFFFFLWIAFIRAHRLLCEHKIISMQQRGLIKDLKLLR